MSKIIMVGLGLFIVVAVVAQGTGPSQITLKPIAASTGCVADASGDVMCAASDGFYISVAGGVFQKIATGTAASPTTISCTTASLTAGTSGTFSASGCTLK